MDNRIRIIGSSHIAKQSIERVTKEIEEFSPDIVTLELDQKRAYALFQKKRRVNYLAVIRSVGLKGFIFSLIGSFAQKKLGNIVGVEPGSEMKTALKVSKKMGIRVMLIDQDIEITLRKFSRAITWQEKWYFTLDILKALVGVRPKLKFDLRKVPDDKIIRKLILEVKNRYPNVYKTLIEDRNRIMAKRLFFISKKKPDKKILAIVGAGHREEMIKLIEKYEREN